MLDTLRDYIRPLTVAALIVMLLLGAVVSGALEAVLPGAGINFTNGIAGWFRAIPEAFYQLTAAGLLGYTAARTFEKATATHSTAKYNPPARNDVDEPEGGA